MVYAIALVNAVRRHPCIWDRDDENYKDSKARKEAWMEIYRSLYRDGADTNDKTINTRIHMLMGKWRSSRDYFVKRQKSQSEGNSKYLRALSFLSSVTGSTSNTKTKKKTVKDEYITDTDRTVTDENYHYFEHEENAEEHSDDVKDDDEEEITIEDPVMITENSYADSYGHVKVIDSLEDFDANKSFAMSLIKEMNGMTEQQNFQFRMEVMKALNTVKYKLPEYSKPSED